MGWQCIPIQNHHGGKPVKTRRRARVTALAPALFVTEFLYGILEGFVFSGRTEIG